MCTRPAVEVPPPAAAPAVAGKAVRSYCLLAHLGANNHATEEEEVAGDDAQDAESDGYIHGADDSDGAGNDCRCDR